MELIKIGDVIINLDHVAVVGCSEPDKTRVLFTAWAEDNMVTFEGEESDALRYHLQFLANDVVTLYRERGDDSERGGG